MEIEKIERTFVMILPEGLKRGLVGKIFTQVEESGLKLIACRMVKPSKEQAASYSADLADYLSSNPVVLMVWDGPKAVSVLNAMASKNLVHASESYDNVEKDILLWFGDKFKDLGDYTKVDVVGSFEAFK